MALAGSAERRCRSIYSRKYHIPPDLVVDQCASEGEGSSNRVFLFLHDVWGMCRRQTSEKIISAISMVKHFTTKSGRIWKCRHCPAMPGFYPCLKRPGGL
jgi:hypothetical protein